MIINKITKHIQLRSDKPNENWLNDDKYLVVDDNSELALKIKKLFPFFTFIFNEKDELIDIEDDYEKREKHIQKQKYLLEIEELKKNLLDTDYKAIKYAEGHISEEEYLSIKDERQAWRDRINELEGELEVLNENNQI